MEGTDDAIGGDNSSQHQTASIASHLTPMTGNGGEVIQTDPQVVDEFDTDSKWEITTLEKASYDDCSDMYAEASPDQQQNLAHSPESASDTNQSAECIGKTDDSQGVSEARAPEHAQSNTRSEDEEQSSQMTIESRQPARDNLTESSHEKEISASPIEEISVDEAKNSSHPPDQTTTAKSPSQEQVEMKAEDNSNNQQEELKNDEIPSLNNDDLADKISSLSPQHQQDDSTFVLSQTAVDPQMEKMIDSMVEGGGCQQFAETLQQQANELTREKEVESIQREISRASNSLGAVDESSDKPAEVTTNVSTTEEAEPKMIVEDHPPTGIATTADVKADEQSTREEVEEDQEATVGKNEPVELEEEKVPEIQAVQPPLPQETTEEPKERTRSPRKRIQKMAEEFVEPAQSSKDQKIAEKQEIKDPQENDCAKEKHVDDKKSLPDRPVRQARLRASKRAASPEPPPKEVHEKRRKSRDEPMQEKPKQRLVIKVPLPSRSASARKTIATSNPSNIPEPIPELKKIPDTSFNDFECKKYRCEDCKYSTDRLNNIVYHKKSSCKSFQKHFADQVAAQVESWKRSIQSPKSNSKRSAR